MEKHAFAVRFFTDDSEGHQVKAGLHEDGSILLDVLARRLASQVVNAAETIEFDNVSKIVVEKRSILSRDCQLTTSPASIGSSTIRRAKP